MENWLKLVSIWSVFWVKVSIFEKVPTHFSKCVFLDYRIFDKCDFIYAKMAKMIFLKKRRTTWGILQYWSVFSGILGKSGQYLVSNMGKSCQYGGQYTDFFLQTRVVITGSITKSSNFDLLPPPKLGISGELPTPLSIRIPPTIREGRVSDSYLRFCFKGYKLICTTGE